MLSPSSLSLFFCENERGGKTEKHKKLKCCSCGEKTANWQTKNYLKLNVHSAAYANMKWSQNHKDTQRTRVPLENG